VYFRDESGYRAYTVHGKTWSKKGDTPVIARPVQRQSISATSAVNLKGAFWYATLDLRGRTQRATVGQITEANDAQSLQARASGGGWTACAQNQTREGVFGRNQRATDTAFSARLRAETESRWTNLVPCKTDWGSRTPLREGEKLSEKIERQLPRSRKCLIWPENFLKTQSVTYVTDQVSDRAISRFLVRGIPPIP
jgi:hypothetical protein